MNSRRIISLILSIMMIFQIFVVQTPVYAMEGVSPTIQKSEGQKTSERTEEFAFKNTKKPDFSWFNAGTMSTYSARSASTTKTETLKITTKAKGLDAKEGKFNWEAFGQNKKFTAWIEVAYVEDKKPGEKVASERYKVSEDFDISSEADIDAQVTLDSSKTVDFYYLKTEYDKDDNLIKVNAIFDYRNSFSPKKQPDLTFKIGIQQIVSTTIAYNLIDEYGKAINLNDDKEEKPADADLKNLAKLGNGTDDPLLTFNLKNNGTDILRDGQIDDEDELIDSSIKLIVEQDSIKSNNIDYKLTSTYDVLKGGKVTIQRQKDAVTPKDPGNPGDIPEGYARLNLSADALGGKTDGTFTKDDPQDTQRVVDVKAGKAYTTAQAEVDKVTKPFPLTSEKKVDTGKTFDKWTPELGTLGNAVAKETKTLNASYKSSDVEIIPYLPTELVPTTDKEGLPIPTNYLTVTFKSEDVNKGKVKIGDKEGEKVLAKVKPGINLSQKAEITTVPATDYGFTKWDPKLGVPQEGSEFTAHFVKSGDKINEGDPIPKGWFKVTVSQDEDSIKSGTVETSVYAVKPNDKLGQDKFADLTDKAKDGYKDPAWYVGSEKVTNPSEKPITTSTDFLARATELESNKIKKDNGLKPVDIKAYKGDEMGEGFWKKGVALNTANEDLQKLLDAATVTDESGRTTAEAGEKVGTLKVTFKDGSTIEVSDQKLIVKDTKVDINFDKKANDDANAPRHNEEVVKGKITTTETVDGALVEVKDSQGNTLGRGLANEDGTFNVGTKRPLKAGEKLKIIVTLPGVNKASAPVEKQVKLNPDELNSILPTADQLLSHLKGKPGLSKATLDKLEEAIKAGKALIDETTKKPVASVTVDSDGQKSLDEAFANIKKAMEDLTENQIPMINGPDHKEIFVGGEIDLDEGVTVADDKIKQVEGKDYTYKIYDASGTEVQKDAMVAKDGVYRVVYSAEDAQGVKASHTMTVVVKKTVVEVPGEFPENTPEGYVKVEFKSGDNAGLNGVSKFLVKKDALKSEVTEPTIIPKEGYKVVDPKWSVAIPDTFAKDFETEAQVLAKATTEKPADKDMDKYATLTFEKGKHGEFDANAQTAIYVLKNEKVQFNAPKVKANDGFTFAKWNPILRESYNEDTKHVAQYASNSDISDVPVKDFQEVKFVSGTDGNFGKNSSTPITEKSVWVRPGKLVDLRTKAPEVTVTTKDKSHIGWDKDLVQTFTKADTATVINAKYDDTVKTTKPTENVDKYAKVDFLAGNLGTITDDATKTYWVVKDAEVMLTPPTVIAKDGWKVKTGNDAWSPAVATKYTQDTIHVAQYDYDGASVIPQKPGEDKPAVPENFVKVEFKKGEHGIISSEYTTIYWVNPEGNQTLGNITKPTEVTAFEGYKFTGWDKEDSTKITTALDVTAQYKEKVVEGKDQPTKPDPNDPGKTIPDSDYAKLTFNKGDNGEFADNAKTTIWVLKNEKVQFNAPEVKANDGFTFAKWDPELQTSYSEDQTHTAKYTSDKNVSDTKVEGFQEVKFTTDSKDGNFGKTTEEPITDITEKSVWVKPNTLVDLTDKQPTVTVTNDKKAYTGWNQKLIAEFAKAEQATEIKALYKDKVVTDNPNDTNYAEIKFVAGNHGTFEKQDEKTTFWVLKGEDVTADFKAPTVTAKAGYTFDKWNPEIQTSYDKDQTHTATYKTNNDVSETEVEGFNKVTFKAGEHGTLTEKSVWVKPDTLVDLTDKAPAVTANQGYSHKGWQPGLVGKFADGSEIVAKYITDIDGNGIEDSKETTPTPSILSARNIQNGENVETKVLVKGKPGATITIKSEDGQTDLGTGTVGTNGQVEIKLNTKQDAGTKIQAIAKLGEMKDSDPAESFVFDDLNDDGKPDGQGKVDFNNIVDMRIASDPKTMKYALTSEAGSKNLDLNGLTVYVKDKNGNSGIYQYGAETNKVNDIQFEELKGNTNFKLELVDAKGENPTAIADGTTIKKANDTNKIKVSIAQNTAKADTTRSLNIFVDANGNGIDDAKEKIDLSKVKDIKVINQPELKYPITEKDGKTKLDLTKMVVEVSDGVTKAKLTAKELLEAKIGEGNEAKAAFKLSLVAGENEKAKITDLTGIELTTANDQNKVKIALADKETVNDKTTALEVFEDLDKDGKRDTKQTPAPTELKALNVKDDKFTTITGKAQKGDTIKVYGEDNKEIPVDNSNITIDDNGNFTIKVSKESKALPENTKIFVTAQANGKEESPRTPVVVKTDKDGNGIADKDETTSEPKVTARNIGKDPKKTTVEIETKPKAKVTIEYTDKDGQTQKIENLTAGEDGKLTYDKIEPALKADTDVKVTVQDGDKQPTEKTVKVFDDLDDNKIPDTQAGQTERPAALASNIGKAPTFTTITGEAEKGATVTAMVGNVVVGTAIADSNTGKYTIEAKQNDASIKQGVKVDVTATLKPKAESFKQTVVVFNDTDRTGQPDSAKDFDVKKAKEMQVISSPEKMVYNDSDQLNLDGLKVLITDVNRNQKIFTYNSKDNTEFTSAGLTVDYKQGDKLTNDDNGKKLTVTLDTKENTEVTEAITGQTPTALTVNKHQSAQPTDVVAANQGDEKVTKVKGKAVKGAEVKITDESGNNLLPEGTTLKAGDNGEFDVKLNKLLDSGTKVFVTATEPGKSESAKAETTVIRDKDGDWKADTGAKLSTPVIDPIREKDEKVVVKAPKADDKIKTIEVSDQKGNTVTLTKDATGNTWTVEGSDPAAKVMEKDGKIEISVKGKLPLNDRDQIKVTFKDGETPANEAFDKAPVQKASQTPKVDPVYTGDKSVKIADPTVADPTAMTIKVKVGDKDSMTIEKQPDGSWKVKEDPNKEVKVVDGKVVVPLDPSAKKDDVIEVSTINDSGKASQAAKVKVEDKAETQKPTIEKANKDENFVSGKAAANAEVTVTVTPKGGEPKTFIGKADEDGNYKVTTDKLVDGDTVVVKASQPGMADSTSDPKVVGVDTSKLQESINKAEDPAIGGNLKPDDNPVDRALKDALDKGKEVKQKGDQNDPNTDQKAVDKAKEELDKAIAQKEADKAVDNAKDNPTTENIGQAQNKIDAIPGSTDPSAPDYNKIKKDLQDKLDLIKKVKEGEDRLKKDDIKDKLPSDVENLQNAVNEGKKAIKSTDSKTITDATKAIEKAIDQINMERIKVTLTSLSIGMKTLNIRTSVPEASVVIKVDGVKIDTITTDAFGAFAKGLLEGLREDQEVTLEASKDGYNDGRYNNTVY